MTPHSHFARFAQVVLIVVVRVCAAAMSACGQP